MKKVSTPLSRSKSAILFVLVAAGISMAIPACKKDNDTTAPALTQEELSLVVTQALGSQGGGLSEQTNAAVDIAINSSAPREGAKITTECGGTYKDSVNISTNEFTYAMKWSWMLSCTEEQQPKSLALDFSGRVRLETAKLAINDSSVATFKVEGLQRDSSLLVFNQTFNRIGKLKFVADSTTRSYVTLLSYKATDVKVSKETRKIVSGTATLNITGTSSNGKAFSYTGTVIYKGGNKGLFTILGGGSIELTL